MTRRAHASCGASSAGGLFSSAGTIPAFADDGLTAFETAIGLLHDGALHQKDGVQPERESPVYAVTSWYRQKCRQAVGSPTASQAPASGPVRTQPFVRRMTAIKRFHSGPWEPRNCNPEPSAELHQQQLTRNTSLHASNLSNAMCSPEESVRPLSLWRRRHSPHSSSPLQRSFCEDSRSAVRNV